MATIRDVARAAGISIATVSRVFNNSSKVSAATVESVRTAAAKLDYSPHGAARSLTLSRTNTLGVLLPDLYGDFFSEVIRGIDHAARRGKFQILVSSSHADTDALVSVARSLRGRVDGLILMVPDAGSAGAVAQITRSLPVVLLNPRMNGEVCDTISIANFEGAYAMVQHLLRLGHRKIAMICGPERNVDAEERLRGFRAALSEADIEPSPDLEIRGDFTESSGYEGALEVLRRPVRPSAIFAGNDYMAIGALSALSSAGITVPKELAVVGFDDIAMAQYLNPSLTTVRVDAYELGARAVQRWFATTWPAQAETTRHEVLPATLVVRSSCGSAQAQMADARAQVRRRHIFLSSPAEAPDGALGAGDDESASSVPGWTGNWSGGERHEHGAQP